MKRGLKQELKTIYQAPMPKRKKEFLNQLDYPKTTKREFVLTQTGYIHKRSWLISILLTAFVIFQGHRLMRVELASSLLWLASAIMPVLALIVSVEVLKSSACGMAELEMSAKHNLGSILLVRMAIMGGLDLLLIAVTIPFVTEDRSIGCFRAAVYLLVPYLLTCAVTLGVQGWKKGKDTIWYSIVSGFFVCMLNMTVTVINVIYDDQAFVFWIGILLALIGVVIKQIWNIKKEVEDCTWSLYSTE